MNGFAGINSSHGRDRASQRQIPRSRPERRPAAASRAAEGPHSATMFLDGLVARGSRFTKQSRVDA